MTVQSIFSAEAASYDPKATMTFVPTGAGFTDQEQLLAFLKEQGEFAASKLRQATSPEEEGFYLRHATTSTMADKHVLVEEGILTVMHDVELGWLLPTVPPSGRLLTFPMVRLHIGALLIYC